MALVDDEKVKLQAQQIIGLYQNLPRLIVFDLDYTLWPFYCEFYDDDDKPYLYPHARGILNTLKDRGIEIAIASRSPTSKTARMLLDKLGLRSMFAAEEIFSSWTHKTEHFMKIQHKTGIPYESMLFFDDEDRNTIAVSKMGVTCILVENGVTLEALRQGLSNFSRKLKLKSFFASMASSSSFSCSLACLLLLVFSFLVLHQVPAAALQQDHQHQLSTNPIPVSAPQDVTYYNDKKMDCGGACAARCQSSSRPRLCKRACGTCCYRCNCVPPGTSGNYDACPCYASLITHGNRRKCP